MDRPGRGLPQTNFIATGDGLRATNLGITINTLYRPTDAADEIRTKQRLAQVVRALAQPENAAQVFGAVAGDSVEVRGSHPETGRDPRGSRVHVHFTVNTRHAGTWRWQDIQRRLADWVKQQWPELRGVYVHIDVLASSYWENYGTKETRTPQASRASQTIHQKSRLRGRHRLPVSEK